MAKSVRRAASDSGDERHAGQDSGRGPQDLVYFQRPGRLLPGVNAPMAHPHEGSLAAAVALGWRVAELYSLVDDPGERSHDTLLPAHGSLAPADQLELHLRAAAGDAKRAGVTSEPASLTALVELARETAGVDHMHSAFRAKLRRCHIEINKDLWSLSEALGKGYELGNGLSDTYGRICRSYRDRDAKPAVVWKRVFDQGRIERLKKLLDDLQSRLDVTAVAVVREQLDTWCAEVRLHVEAADPDKNAVLPSLRRQTVIWRQLVAGDKHPEAYLETDERAQIRDTMRHLVWKRYRALLPLLVLVLTAIVLVLPKAAEWYRAGFVRSGVASAVVAAIGALGITQASLVLTVRTRLHEWSDLLWQRAVVSEVARATLTVEQAFPRPETHAYSPLVDATARAGQKLRTTVTSRAPRAQRGGLATRGGSLCRNELAESGAIAAVDQPRAGTGGVDDGRNLGDEAGGRRAGPCRSFSWPRPSWLPCTTPRWRTSCRRAVRVDRPRRGGHRHRGRPDRDADGGRRNRHRQRSRATPCSPP